MSKITKVKAEPSKRRKVIRECSVCGKLCVEYSLTRHWPGKKPLRLDFCHEHYVVVVTPMIDRCKELGIDTKAAHKKEKR
jgi:hypothetical protein